MKISCFHFCHPIKLNYCNLKLLNGSTEAILYLKYNKARKPSCTLHYYRVKNSKKTLNF